MEKANFINWLYNLDVCSFDYWALVGDFSFTRSPENRTKPGGSVNDMVVFNDLIKHLDLIKVSFQGMQNT